MAAAVRMRVLAIVGLAAALVGCGGGFPSSPTGQPQGPVTVSGTVLGTIARAPLQPYTISLGDTPSQSASGAYSLTVPRGTYDVTVEGASLRYRRLRRSVAVNGDTRLDLFAVEAGHPFDLHHFSQSCLGIDSPNPSPTGSINQGSSKRFRDGVPIVFLILDNYRTPGGTRAPVPEPYLQATETAIVLMQGYFAGLADISYRRTEVEENAGTRTEGSIQVSHRHQSGSGASPTGYSGEYIQSSSVVMGMGPDGKSMGSINGYVHEYLHAFGLDHTDDRGSVMRQGTPKANFSGKDRDCIRWKYSRRAGATLDGVVDVD